MLAYLVDGPCAGEIPVESLPFEMFVPRPTRPDTRDLYRLRAIVDGPPRRGVYDWQHVTEIPEWPRRLH
jgi:hypothetical protein